MFTPFGYTIYQLLKDFPIRKVDKYPGFGKIEYDFLLSPSPALSPRFHEIHKKWANAMAETSHFVNHAHADNILASNTKSLHTSSALTYLEYRLAKNPHFILFPLVSDAWLAFHPADFPGLVHYEFMLKNNEIAFHIHFGLEDKSMNLKYRDNLLDFIFPWRYFFSHSLHPVDTHGADDIKFITEFRYDFFHLHQYHDLMAAFYQTTVAFVRNRLQADSLLCASGQQENLPKRPGCPDSRRRQGERMQVLVTGAAGFIGYHLSKRLLHDGCQVVGIDNLNDYYSPQLKQDRLRELGKLPHSRNFSFQKIDLADQTALAAVFANTPFTHVVNLAAQAGVRHSLVNPQSYIDSNLVGFTNLLEQCRHHSIGHLLFASSSSVYGLNTAKPYTPHENVDHPASLYAATKKSNELMAHAYSHLFKLPTTGLRFFTVYGPWGRPDMALHLFTDAILKGKPISLFNNGHLKRDFTYIDDIIEGVVRLIDKAPQPEAAFDSAHPDPATSSAPWRIYNIGNDQPVELETFVAEIEKATGKKAEKKYLPMQPCDVEETWADISDLAAVTGFRPATNLGEGIRRYMEWHRDYYKLA